MEKKLGQESAFPTIENFNGIVDHTGGVSKRFYAACAAMQGILASSGEHDWIDVKITATKSLEYADELLKQENE